MVPCIFVWRPRARILTQLSVAVSTRWKPLFASVYDDDVFFFGLCEKSGTVSKQIGGDCEAYGLRPESCHIEALESFLSNGEKTSPKLNGLSGPELEAVLTEALGFRLNLE